MSAMTKYAPASGRDEPAGRRRGRPIRISATPPISRCSRGPTSRPMRIRCNSATISLNSYPRLSSSRIASFIKLCSLVSR